MKLIHPILGILFSFCLIPVLLITSVEAVTYWTPGYYENEYAKYNVTEKVNMQMDDLLYVTREMMSYLKGKRQDLHVITTIGGQSKEFFNEREIAHMEDVRGLFMDALAIRRICLLIMAVSIALLLAARANLKLVLPRMLCFGTSIFLLIAVISAAIISTDFNKYFVMFHHIFFNNDLWILNPQTDLLINIVPEPFFMDTAARIAVVFAASIIIILSFSIFCIKKYRGRRF